MTVAEYKHQWYLDNAERIKEKARARYTQKKDEIKAYQKKYRATHPGYVKEQSRRQRALNPDKNRIAQKKYVEGHREKRREIDKAYRASKPEIHAATERNRRAAKLGNGGTGWSAKEERELTSSYGNLCVYCGNKAEGIDHVVALANGGAHDLNNAVPACAKCNSSKGKKPLLQWLYARREYA